VFIPNPQPRPNARGSALPDAAAAQVMEQFHIQSIPVLVAARLTENEDVPNTPTHLGPLLP